MPQLIQHSPPAAILVVEDEWITARDIQQTLVDLGYRVTGLAVSGRAALDSAEADRPDLALVDIRLDGPMDGVELAEEMRRRWALPVVYLTAHSDQETIDRVKASEPLGYISKPFDHSQLRVVVELALHGAAGNARRRREADCDRERARELAARTASLEGQLRQIAAVLSAATGVGPGQRPSGAFEAGLTSLSRRELEIVQLLVQSRRVTGIARDLSLSVNTVRNHLRSVFRKLGVHSQEELIDAARLLPPDSKGSRL